MLSIKSIRDPGYFLNAGSGCCAKTTETPGGEAGYRMDAIAGGEPPGRWFWVGENAFGATAPITVGGEGEKQFVLAMALLHPLTGEQLGATPMTSRGWAARVEAWKKAHPGATQEEVDEYRMGTMKNEQNGRYADDLTFSPAKSVSVTWASWMWAGRTDDAETLFRCVEQGAEAALRHVHEQLAFIQTKPTGPELGGRRTAIYESAQNLQMALFRHHVSREGDPQIHIHAVMFNRVLNELGKWRALYSPAFYKAKHEADAVFQRTLEAALARELGLRFEWTADGKSREIEGVSEEVRKFFSSRDRALSEYAQEEVDHFTATKGRAPNDRERWRIRQRATLKDRKAKQHLPPEQRVEQWERDFARDTKASLAEVRDAVDEARAKPGEEIVVPRYDRGEVIARAVAQVEKRSVWTKSLLIDAINDQLPAMLATPQEDLEALLDGLAEEAMRSALVLSVEVAPAVEVPKSLRDARSGRSKFEAPEGRRFTTKKTLDTEDSIVAQLDQGGAPKVPASRAAELVEGSEVSAEQEAPVKDALSSGRWLEVIDAPAGTGKSTMGRVLSRATEAQWGIGVTGFAIAENAAKVLRTAGMSRAHNIESYLDFKRREDEGKVSDGERAKFAIAVGSYLWVDEASTVDTARLAEFLRRAREDGAGKVLLVGDRKQADPVDAGGAFAMLVDELEQRRTEWRRAQQRTLPAAERTAGDTGIAAWTSPAVEREPAPVHRLRTVRRFSQPWEGRASTGLREGDVTVLRQYETRARLHGHTDRDKVRAMAVDNFMADFRQGRDAAIITGTTEEASAANSAVRERLVRAGEVEAEGAPVAGQNTAGVGDLVQTRENSRTVGVINRQRWQVVGRHEDGSLEVREELERGPLGQVSYGPVKALTSSYVQTQVELAYAGTVLAYEGTTIKGGSSHTIASRHMTSSHLYVGASRATEENHVYVELEPNEDADRARAKVVALERRHAAAVSDADRRGVEHVLVEARAKLAEAEKHIETPISRLAAVLSRDDHEPAARTAIAVEQDRATNLGHLGPQWEFLVRETRAVSHRAMLRETLGDEADLVLRSRASTRLFGLLRGAELSGHDPQTLLAEVTRQGSIASANDPAHALYGRLAKQMAAREKDRPVPLSFESRVPAPSLGDRENERLSVAGEIGRAMDRRVALSGELAALDAPLWAVREAGPVPESPEERSAWVGRVALAAGYRERYGVTDERSALGTRPPHAEPERRWWYDTAAQAIGIPEHRRDLEAQSDGQLAHTIQVWERVLGRMPRNVDEDLLVAHTARLELRDRFVDAELAGEDATHIDLELAENDAWIAKLEEVADARALLMTAHEDARLAAVEARRERDRREDVERAARGEAHRDDPGPAEPDEPEPEDAESGDDTIEPDERVVEGVEPEVDVEALAATFERIAAVAAAVADREVPVFGSREWVELGDDDPAKAAAVVEAARRWWNVGEPLDRDAAEVTARLDEHQRGTETWVGDAEYQAAERPEGDQEPERDVEVTWSVAVPVEPVREVDVEALAGVHAWSQRHLEGEAPVWGSRAWSELPEGDPQREAAEVRAALSWHNAGDPLDARRARLAERDEKAAALAVSQARIDQREAEQERVTAERSQRHAADRKQVEADERLADSDWKPEVSDEEAAVDGQAAAELDRRAPESSDTDREVARLYLESQGVQVDEPEQVDEADVVWPEVSLLPEPEPQPEQPAAAEPTPEPGPEPETDDRELRRFLVREAHAEETRRAEAARREAEEEASRDAAEREQAAREAEVADQEPAVDVPAPRAPEPDPEPTPAEEAARARAARDAEIEEQLRAAREAAAELDAQRAEQADRQREVDEQRTRETTPEPQREDAER